MPVEEQQQLQEQEPIPEIIPDQSQVVTMEYNPEGILPEKVKHTLYKVKVNHPSVRYRSEPSLDAQIVGLITDMGIYEISEERNSWGRLKNGCWIMLQYCSKIEE